MDKKNNSGKRSIEKVKNITMKTFQIMQVS